MVEIRIFGKPFVKTKTIIECVENEILNFNTHKHKKNQTIYFFSNKYIAKSKSFKMFTFNAWSDLQWKWRKKKHTQRGSPNHEYM